MRGRTAALAVFGLALAGPFARGQSDPVSPASFLLPPVAADAPTDPTPQADRPPRAAKLTIARESKPVSADVAERVHKAERPADPPLTRDELFDHLNDGMRGRRTSITRDPDRDGDPAPRRRDSWAFGDRIKGLFDGDKGRGWFQSDHAFDAMVSPLTNPFLFEDPRSLTEVRPIFIYQKVPSPQPNFNGGSIWFVGAQGRIALTDRVSITINKFGATAVDPSGLSHLGNEFGFAEFWFGPKFTLIRDTEFGTLLAAGANIQLPAGQGKVFQDTGKLSVAPYLTLAQPFLKTRLGTFNGMLNGGYSYSVNKDRSDYFWGSAHLDYDVGNAHRFYPLIEANWFQYTTNGQSRFIAGEGRDLINFGGLAKGSNLLTGAVGGRVKLTKSLEFGAGYELPILGNRDFFKSRFTVDLIWRY